MINLQIKVTKDILQKSQLCGLVKGARGYNCAIALCVKNIFPSAYICTDVIYPFGLHTGEGEIALPEKATAFINEFDGKSPEEIVQMPEIEFTISIPEEIINQIDISEITKQLENHPHLKLKIA